MDGEEYEFTVDAENLEDASRYAGDLADSLLSNREILEARRKKGNNDTMDLGSIVSVVVTSGAMLALAQGLADWLRSHKNVTVRYKKKSGEDSVALAVSKIDAATAKRIIEMLQNDES